MEKKEGIEGTIKERIFILRTLLTLPITLPTLLHELFTYSRSWDKKNFTERSIFSTLAKYLIGRRRFFKGPKRSPKSNTNGLLIESFHTIIDRMHFFRCSLTENSGNMYCNDPGHAELWKKGLIIIQKDRETSGKLLANFWQ